MDHDMSGMGGGDSNSGYAGGMTMMMTFTTNTKTPLYATNWTPTSAGAYAGTCIFLVVLAIFARLLVALKAAQEVRWENQAANRKYVAVNGKVPLAERISQDRDAKQMVLTENGVEETVFVVERRTHASRPWRFSVDPVRAVLDTAIVGVGYLLQVPNLELFLSTSTDSS